MDYPSLLLLQVCPTFHFIQIGSLVFCGLNLFILVYALFSIGIIDCTSSYGIVLFYPFYQWVRSSPVLILTSGCREC